MKLHIRLLWILSFSVSSQVFADNCPNFPNYCIATGNPQFTYFKIGKDLSSIVARDARIDLLPIPGGSIENVQKLKNQNGVKFAIVQSDVLSFYNRKAKEGNLTAKGLINKLRVVMPLHTEELHIMVAVDSDIEFFHDLRGKKIALGSKTGGSAMTGLSIYEAMFGKQLKNAYYSSSDDAYRALAEGQVDAWIMVVGQPTKKFQNISEKAASYIKFVKFDTTSEIDRRVLNGSYYKSKILKSSYSWVNEDVDTVAVKAFLITQKYTKPETKRNITEFTKSLCRNHSKLQKSGHTVWNSIDIDFNTLPGGWKFSDDVLHASKSRDCLGGSSGTASQCTEKLKILGLCSN